MDAPLPDVEELLASRARLVVSADEERRELERELHDGVQQRLVALAVELQLAQRLHRGDPEVAAVALGEVRRNLLQAVDDLRRFADLLYPALLDDQGLGVALRAAAAQVAVPARVEVPPDRVVPAEIALTAYLCCARMLAAGRCMSLRVALDDDLLRFEVVAADPHAATEAISRLADRVESLGGRLTVGQNGPEGARVTGILPVRA